MVADPGKAGGDQLALGEQFLAVAHGESISDDPAITVGGDVGAAQHDVVAANERIERGFGGGARRCASFKRRHFDRGQADFAAVIERESTAVDDAFGDAVRNHVAAANRRRLLLLLRHRAGTSAKSCKLDRQRSGQKDPTTPSHHRRPANGGNTAVLRRAWMLARPLMLYRRVDRGPVAQPDRAAVS